MKELFRKFSNRVSAWAGSAGTFLLAIAVVIVWGLSGPLFDYSDTWQLAINTGTTIVTFLMVFLIQNTQNRDSKAQQLKLDELIHSTKSARNSFVNLENLTDEDLAVLDEEFQKIHQKYADKTPASVHKIHEKIEKEHQRRIGLRQAGQVLTSFSNILTSPITGKPDETPPEAKKAPKKQ